MMLIAILGHASDLRINQIQFIGSHNSYKQAMSEAHFRSLYERNPNAAQSLEYEHPPITEQLALGLRKLELDIFNTLDFRVGHVQDIDMNTSCSPLSQCFDQILDWSRANPVHVPIWISFNAKDTKIEGLSDPKPFDAASFRRLDKLIERYFGNRLIRPAKIKQQANGDPIWPFLSDSRGKFIFILDEAGQKRELYQQETERPMFTTSDENEDPSAAVLIINDPVHDGVRISNLVRRGFMVRTRADADTLEARANDPRRRDAALASGAQAISTDYYTKPNNFGTDYLVRIEGAIRCNPVNADQHCSVPIE